MYKTQLYQWPDKLLFIGPLGEVGAHRHGANAWCLPLDGELGFAPGRGDEWRRVGGVQIALGQEHRLHGGGRPVAVLYLHPEFDHRRNGLAPARRAGARLLPQMTPAEEQLLNDAYRGNLGVANLVELGAGLDRFLRDRQGGVPASPAVITAASCLRAHLDRNLPIAAVADAARLSPGRLAHRFSAELGLPMRRFRNWHRLGRALSLALNGSSLSAAALDAGFASPAHLSSAFLATFGLPPSAVLRAPGLEFALVPAMAAHP